MADTGNQNIILQGFKLLASLISLPPETGAPKFEGNYKDRIAGKPISFLPPDGFQLPDGSDQRAAFTGVATLRLRDGKMQLLEIDGAPVYDDEPEETPDGNLGDNVFLESLKQRLPPSGMPD